MTTYHKIKTISKITKHNIISIIIKHNVYVSLHINLDHISTLIITLWSCHYFNKAINNKTPYLIYGNPIRVFCILF